MLQKSSDYTKSVVLGSSGTVIRTATQSMMLALESKWIVLGVSSFPVKKRRVIPASTTLLPIQFFNTSEITSVAVLTSA